jgi:hypothetical protein
MVSSRPTFGSNGSGWRASATETSATNAQWQLAIFAICADTPVPFGASF